MRSLFLKIFLWFWLATAAIGAALVLVTMAAQPEAPPENSFISGSMQARAERMVRTYESSGSDALQRSSRRYDRPHRSQVFLFNADNRMVATNENVQEVPQAAIDLSRRVLATPGREAVFEVSGTNVLSARPVRGQRGDYVVVHLQRRSLWREATMGVRGAPPIMKFLRFATIFLVAGLVCYGLARYLTSPTVALRHATRQFAAGDLSTRVAPKMGRRRDELADLARDFDSMAERIGDLLSTQRRLLSDISHELRSPLARLQLALSLAEREVEKGTGQSHAQLRNNLERIARETERLDSLIGQLLSLTRMESGEARLKLESFDLSELARAVAEDADFEARGQSKRVLLQVDQSDNYSLIGDREWLRSAIENVVRNAIRHTPQNSSVTMTLQQDVLSRVLCVCDEGEGVAEENLPHLFEPFFRADDARQHDGGVGLGLAITCRAVRSHGGEVSARNQESGGLCFEIRLPLRPPATEEKL